MSESHDDLGYCPNCGEEVYLYADRCPACGDFITPASCPRSAARRRTVVLALIALATLIGFLLLILR
jgi:predicted amidophosphoribosyltransferase